MDWKKPFGWKGSARFSNIMRRPAAIAIVVIGVLAAAIPFATRQPSTRGGGNPVTARRDAKQETRTATSAPARQSTSPAAAKSTPVTITGCLERDDQTFRLKDTAGTGAPKSRSWKTGFLKKRSASVEVVDATNQLKMNNYVGQRVSLTGTLVDRELHARVLKRIASSCAAGKSAKSAAKSAAL